METQSNQFTCPSFYGELHCWLNRPLLAGYRRWVVPYSNVRIQSRNFPHLSTKLRRLTQPRLFLRKCNKADNIQYLIKYCTPPRPPLPCSASSLEKSSSFQQRFAVVVHLWARNSSRKIVLGRIPPALPSPVAQVITDNHCFGNLTPTEVSLRPLESNSTINRSEPIVMYFALVQCRVGGSRMSLELVLFIFYYLKKVVPLQPRTNRRTNRNILRKDKSVDYLFIIWRKSNAFREPLFIGKFKTTVLTMVEVPILFMFGSTTIVEGAYPT